MTQCDRILRHLEEHGVISSIEAMREYGIMRLASRIHDLKRMGYKITSKTNTRKNKYGETVYFKVYRLAEAEKENSNGKLQS